MITSDLRPYTTYKPSGVEWLGDVPAHWEVRRLQNVIDMRVSNVDKHVRGDEVPVRLCNYVDVYNNDYINEQMNFMQATATDEEIDRFRLEKDDVLITKDSETWDDIGVPALVTKPATDLISGYHLAMLRPRIDELAGGYLLRALQSKGLAYQFHIEAKGVTRYGLSHARIKSVWLPLPPLPEQTAIVRFLDHADRRIQRYIRAKQKLITLLEEQKQAVIQRAVMGQVDVRTRQPYPAYKPSGVEWLGQVPEHWEVRRARYLFREIDQRSSDGSEQHLSMSQSLGLVPSHLVENRTLVSENYAGGKLCRSGDLVLNRLKAHLGVFARAQQSGVISTDYTVLRPNREAKTEYFEQVLRSPSCRGELRIRAKGIVEGFWRLYTDDLNDIYLPLPTEGEQESIIRWIQSISTRTGRDAGLVGREVTLLQEYRTRLIADVVTGKLDVRRAAAGLAEDDVAGDAAETAVEYK